MKKFITAALLAAVAMPTAAVALPNAAEAQSYRDRHDRHDNRGRHHDARRDRNWGDNDWRDYRRSNRGIYSRGNWRAPFRYQRWSPGVRIGASFYSRGYHVSDWNRYRLPRPGYNQVWVRHYDDLILVDTRRGRVIRVINGFYF